MILARAGKLLLSAGIHLGMRSYRGRTVSEFWKGNEAVANMLGRQA